MNQEKILCCAIIDYDVDECSNPEDLSEDWFSYFFDKAKLVSDESVQKIWGRLLSKEINKPGTCSKQLIHTLSIMSVESAKCFMLLVHHSIHCCQPDYQPFPANVFPFLPWNQKTYSLFIRECGFKDEYQDYLLAVDEIFRKVIFGQSIESLVTLSLVVINDKCNIDRVDSDESFSFCLGKEYIYTPSKDSTNRYHDIYSGFYRYTNLGKELFELVDDGYRENIKDAFLDYQSLPNLDFIMNKGRV